MRRTTILVILASVMLLSAVPVGAYQVCPMGGGGAGDLGGRVQIIGTHYDALGNATKVTCDTTAGDHMLVYTFGALPPHLRVDLIAVTPSCSLLEWMINSFATFGPGGTEVQVVKNGVPKRACVFHGAVEYFDSAQASYWAAHTLRKFNSAGSPTTESGSFSINSFDGQVFIGKIKIKYP